MNGTEENDYIGQTLRQAMPDDLPAVVEQRMQSRLATFREKSNAAGWRPEPARHWNRVKRWTGELTMRQRIAALGGVGIATLLGFLLLWGVVGTRPVSAMEQMAAEIRKAKSCKTTATGKTTFIFKFGGPPQVHEERMTEYWLAPDSVRMEVTDPSRWDGPGPERVKIAPGGNRPSLMIDNRAKTYRLRPLTKEAATEISLFSPDKLGNYFGKADRELGEKEINGRMARGFVIGTNKINPNLPSPGLLEIWLDCETNLPIFIRSEVTTEHGSATSVSGDIQWNVDFDPKLFDTTPPEGYRDSAPKAPTSGDPVGKITEALRIYVHYGHYPPKAQKTSEKEWVETELSMLDTMQSEWEHGKMPFQGKEDPEQTKIRTEKAVKIIAKQRDGYLQLWTLVEAGRDVAYYGATVGPNDNDKVLLRWKLDDGRYQVIFGDLRADTVTAEKLRALEAK